MAPKSSNSRGVAILFKKDLEYKIHSQYCAPEGNFIVVDISLTNTLRCTLVNIYGPNKDSPLFYTIIRDKLQSLDNPEIILCGDWNIVRYFKQDTYKYLRFNNPKARDSINQLIEQFDLSDIWINSRGVAILFKKDLEYKIHSQYCAPEGNFIVVDISLTNTLRCTLHPKARDSINQLIEQFDLSDIWINSRGVAILFKKDYIRIN